MKTTTRTFRPDEQGYVLVASLVTLLLLTVLGIWASRTTHVELRTAANERIHQETFYQADAGTHLAERLVYHSNMCSKGFSDAVVTGHFKPILNFDKINSLKCGNGTSNCTKIWNPPEIKSRGDSKYDETKDEPSDTNYTFRYCPNRVDGECKADNQERPYTNVLIGHKTEFKSGQGLLQAAGYEGFGAGAANVGYYTRYKIRSQHKGLSESEYQVNVIWQLSGLNAAQMRPEDCLY